jgi:hypothetical protein
MGIAEDSIQVFKKSSSRGNAKTKRLGPTLPRWIGVGGTKMLSSVSQPRGRLGRRKVMAAHAFDPVRKARQVSD